jgi:16S rRNA (cytosine1402-N4)-methyltransferase
VGITSEPAYHPPVLLKEVVEYLQPRPGGVYVDATCGTAGHVVALLEACPQARIVGIERDPILAVQARRRVLELGFPAERFVLVEGAYSRLRSMLKDLEIVHVDGCLFDLGACSLHFHSSGRGFSFRGAGEPLDMRYDPRQGPTAADLLARLSAAELERCFRDLGDERWARRIARRIVERRGEGPPRTAGDLAGLVERAIPRRNWPRDIHPATRVFQSLRILVNGEFEELEAGLPQAIEALRPGGRVAAISFHSGEDRRVKRIFRDTAQGPPDPITGRRPPPRGRLVTRRPVGPGEEEVRANPGARSAKLRVLEKCAPGGSPQCPC